MVEIERKFTVKTTGFLKGLKGKNIIQGYLSDDPQRTVRIRIKEDHAYITIKGASSSDGSTRYEWERSIGLSEAHELLALSLPGTINKTRYEIDIDKHTWEIDVFHTDNQGLVIAEIELNDINDAISIPEWIDKEVTGDARYYNSYLSKKPYSRW